jgi:streptogramin lyase
MNKAFIPPVMLVLVVLSACTPAAIPEMSTPKAASPTAAPALTATPAQVPAASSESGHTAVVVYVKDGSILVWDEATRQTETIYTQGDAVNLTMSNDGQLIAFLRRAVIQRTADEWFEQSSLWAMDRSGGNQRELISAEALRGLLNAEESDSSNIPQMEWIPGTHRLIYTAWTYFVQAEGESHAFPDGLYVVDADTGENTVLLPAGNSLEFLPAPDGQKIALISTTALGFIHVDGSNYRPDALPYVQVGMVTQDFPKGVWTQDSSGFLIAGVFDLDPITRSSAIWRVPMGGSSAERLATFNDSPNDSVTFSPNGRHAAFYRGGGPGGWFITPLVPEVGWLDVPKSPHFFWQNIHWSPDGVAHSVSDTSIFQLCPDAVQHTEVCGEGVEMEGWLAGLTWLDSNRFIYITREPYDLYFGRLDGTSVLIAEGAERFAAIAMTCQNAAEFAPAGEGPSETSVKAGTLFRMTWRVRNSGSCTWASTYRLIHISGRSLGGPNNLPVGESVAPGGEVELSVNLSAPSEIGGFRDEWQLLAPDGRPFGIRLPVDISVPSFNVMDFPPELIVARIPASHNAAYGEGALWVLYEGSLSRIDLGTNQVVSTLTVIDEPPFGGDITIGYGSVWVLKIHDKAVARIDPSTNTISAIIPIQSESEPNNFTVGSGAVWVNSDSTNGVITRIDPATNEIVAAINVGEWPNQLAATEDAVWITSPINPILRRIDPVTNEVTSINLDCATRSIAASETDLWLLCEPDPMILRVDPLTNQVVAKIAVDSRSRGLVMSANAVWVSSMESGTLSAIDPAFNQVYAVYRVGQAPVILTGSQDEFWLLMNGEGTIWRIKP